jgi:CRP-like cAMP-binding protein
VIPAGDTVYKALDSGGSIYCLISGRMVKYECENLLEDLLTPVDHDDEVIILEGDTFGESSLFLDICSKRAETVTAITYSKLAVLSMHDIIILSNDYPEIEVYLHPLLLPL